MKVFVFLCFAIISCSSTSAQTSNKANELFGLATESLLKQELKKAEENFQGAKAQYININNNNGVGECLMGLATIYFIKGDYDKSLLTFNELEKNKLMYFASDPERMKTIESSISMCLKMIDARSIK